MVLVGDCTSSPTPEKMDLWPSDVARIQGFRLSCRKVSEAFPTLPGNTPTGLRSWSYLRTGYSAYTSPNREDLDVHCTVCFTPARDMVRFDVGRS